MRLLATLQQFDSLTFLWCMRRRHKMALTKLSLWISKTADGYLYLALIPCCWLLDQSYLLGIMFLGFVAERSIYWLLKNTCKRNRPPEAIPGFKSTVQPSDQFSFPSGHTSAAFLVAGFLSFALPPLAWILYPWACGVGAARVMLGVHFPCDTLVGAAMGSSIAFLTIQLFMDLL